MGLLIVLQLAEWNQLASGLKTKVFFFLPCFQKPTFSLLDVRGTNNSLV